MTHLDPLEIHNPPGATLDDDLLALIELHFARGGSFRLPRAGPWPYPPQSGSTETEVGLVGQREDAESPEDTVCAGDFPDFDEFIIGGGMVDGAWRGRRAGGGTGREEGGGGGGGGGGIEELRTRRDNGER